MNNRPEQQELTQTDVFYHFEVVIVCTKVDKVFSSFIESVAL